VGQTPLPFNPTSPFTAEDLIISPVNGAAQLVILYQTAHQTLDVYTEILGNPTLESELVAAANQGVKVRMISPFYVNGGGVREQKRQFNSLTSLSAAGVDVHVNGRETPPFPYMHARAAVVDGQIGYLGSLSLSPNSTTYNREMGLVLREQGLVQQLQAQFDSDYQSLTKKF
jgi:phosphatidylserine/phosphatidylglycerophosphate/cardiolipin synthase-like enzyme